MNRWNEMIYILGLHVYHISMYCTLCMRSDIFLISWKNLIWNFRKLSYIVKFVLLIYFKRLLSDCKHFQTQIFKTVARLGKHNCFKITTCFPLITKHKHPSPCKQLDTRSNVDRHGLLKTWCINICTYFKNLMWNTGLTSRHKKIFYSSLKDFGEALLNITFRSNSVVNFSKIWCKIDIKTKTV